MPGGSVNGRPFRESLDAYSRTGIPCGNPKRYQSREVVKMGVQNSLNLSKPLTGPVEDIETEGERQLQSLLHKQLNTKITLKGHFDQHKRFTDAVCHQPVTDNLSGTFTLDQYQGVSHRDQYISELKHCGLTEEEIDLKLEDMGIQPQKVKKLRLNLEPGLKKEKLHVINEKIANKKKELENSDHFSGARLMGRHEMDLENAISSNNSRTKLLACLLTRSRVSTGVSNDPMDHLPEILAEVTKRAGKRKLKRKHREIETEVVSETETSEFKSDTVNTSKQGEVTCATECTRGFEATSIDCTQNINILNTKNSSFVNFEKNMDSIQNEKAKNIGDISLCDPSSVVSPDHAPNDLCESTTTSSLKPDPSIPRTISSPVAEIPLSEIVENRLSVDQIREIPRFRDYAPGVPSKVLYVKNLPNKVKEEELVSMFVRFQKTSGVNLLFKLMTGRMRGQAFITFPDIPTATEALSLLNGYLFKGKPLIIQYGRQEGS